MGWLRKKAKQIGKGIKKIGSKIAGAVRKVTRSKAFKVIAAIALATVVGPAAWATWGAGGSGTFLANLSAQTAAVTGGAFGSTLAQQQAAAQAAQAAVQAAQAATQEIQQAARDAQDAASDVVAGISGNDLEALGQLANDAIGVWQEVDAQGRAVNNQQIVCEASMCGAEGAFGKAAASRGNSYVRTNRTGGY